MALAQIDRSLESETSGYSASILRWQDMKIDQIRERLLTEGPEGILSGGLNLGALGELRNDLVNRRSRIANFGRGQVNQELKRQRRAER